MLVLGLDTALRACSVAILKDAVTLAHKFAPLDKGHAERLAPMVRDALSEAGVRAADLDRVGVVVTDLRMPGLDGLSLIRRLRAGAPGKAVPEVVLMSGHASPEELRAAHTAGARAVLRKPFAWDDLANAVDSALATARQRLDAPQAPIEGT